MICIGDFSTTANLSIIPNTGKIIINKTDEETSKPIEGVTFSLSKADGTIVGTATTNSKGVATFSNLYQGDYIIKEVQTNENYVLNTAEFNVSVLYNKEVKIDITNEYKKGNLKVIKVDSDKNEIKLEGVKFELLDSDGKVIDKLTTDENGEIYVENLKIGNYTLKEIKTQENYVLNEEDFSVTIEYDNTTVLTICNEYKKGSLKVYKIDADENRITLGGVVFDLIDENGEIIDTLTTDINGEIYVENLRIGKYILKEKQAKNYYEKCDDIEIEIKWKDCAEVIIKNELTKGQVQVIKVDKEDNEVKLEGVSFAVLDEEMRLLEVITTDENGEALTSRYSLRDYEKIYLQEIATKENYVLNFEIIEVQLEANKVTNITIENEMKKEQPQPQIEIELPKTGLENELLNSVRDIIILGFLSILYIKTKYFK